MKKAVLLLIFILPGMISMAQSNIRLNNDWNKTYIINPASITSDYLAEFNMAARQQWLGFQGSPTTLFASGTLYLDELYTQFGLKVMQDKVGFTSTTDIDLTLCLCSKGKSILEIKYGFRIKFSKSGV